MVTRIEHRERYDVHELGSEDSYSESEIIDLEDEGYYTGESDYEAGDKAETGAEEAEEGATDRIGKLTGEFQSSLTKQQQVLNAHISILTSALGGVDYSSESEEYLLGDDALACLKDIKRWLKAVDELEKKWDVALACAETGLVVNDLIVILAQWENDSRLGKIKNKNYMEKVLLLILELLVPLTWPLRLTKESNANQIVHYPNLNKAQLSYKKLVIDYQDGKVLKAVIRLTLPIISKPKNDRTPRDNAILRLCIYFFRNILKIAPANSTVSMKKVARENVVQDNLPADVTLDDISLSAVVESYERNNVLDFLLTVTNLLGSDLDERMLSMGCLECLYHLVDGVKVERLFEGEDGSTTSTVPTNLQKESTAQLQDLLNKEKNLKKTMVKNSSSRHGRFGTLLSLQTHDNGRLTISGQKAFSDNSSALAQLDEKKTWRPGRAPQQMRKFGLSSELSEKLGKGANERFLGVKSSKALASFMDELVEGCFNPLSYSLRREFLAADDLSFNVLQYFDLVTWIIGYETERRIRSVKHGDNHTFDNGYFTSVLEDDFFTLVVTCMRKAHEDFKEWSLVQSCLRCFKQVLSFADLIGSTSQESSDQLMSHNLKQRLFMKEVTLDLFASLPRNAYKISPDYVITVVELTYVVLKTLEKFSKDDNSLYIAAKRASRRKKAATRGSLADLQQDQLDSEEEDDLPASKEVKSLNFLKYQNKFIHRDTIQTHISLFERYREVSEHDIKRCISFFYRVFYICERHLDLFRIDFMILLHQMTGNGPDSLPRSSSLKKEVISFTKYYMKKLTECLERSPSLFAELCFNSTPTLGSRAKYFLEKGEILKEQKTYKVAAPLFFKRGYEVDTDRKFAIIVAYMIDNSESDLVEWVKMNIVRVLDLRRKWFEEQNQLDTAENGGSVPDLEKGIPPVETLKGLDERFQKLLIRNGRLRLLLKTIGFDLPEETHEECELGSDVTVDQLLLALGSISKYLKEAVKFPEGKTASEYITRSYDQGGDESDTSINYGRFNDVYDEDEEDIAFETGRLDLTSKGQADLDKLDELESQLRSQREGLGHAKRRKLKKPSSARRRLANNSNRNRYDQLEMHDVSDVEADPRKLPKSYEYRSSEFIQDSDDEDDTEFFEKEKFLRELLSLNGGILQPEHAKLFADGSWRSYKITVSGDLAERNVYDKLPTLDQVVKQSQVSGTQQTSQMDEESDLHSVDGEKSQIALEDSGSGHDNESDNGSEIDQDSASGSLSPNIDADISKRTFENVSDDASDDEQDLVLQRKRVRRVLDSDDE